MSALFALIHSLTPSEKRYFGLYAKRQVQQKSTNYLKLFDAINNQEVYNEELLLKKFRKEVFAKQYAVTKNYLFQMILKSMKEYNEETYIEWKIRNNYLQIKILASKGLDAETEKLIAKTKELAWQYEYYYVVMDVLNIEKYLLGNFRIYEPTDEVFSKIVAEDNTAADISFLHTQIGHVWHYLTNLELQIGVLPNTTIKAKADAYVGIDCMQQEPPTSYNAKFRYYATWSLYYNLINDQKKNYDSCRKCILIREEQIDKQPLQNLDPLASYYNFLVACEKANQWDQFELYLEKTKAYDAQTIEVNIRRMHNYCWCGLMYYLHQKNYQQAAQIVAEYKAFFIDKRIGFRKDFKIYIDTACGLVCLFNKQYKDALQWWQPILNAPLTNVELRSQGAVRLYLMMLHFEENNNTIMDYLGSQAKRFLTQISMWHQPEKLLVKQLIGISNQPDKKCKKELLKTLQSQLAAMPLSISGNACNSLMLDWLERLV